MSTCKICGGEFHSLGLASHRAACHRRFVYEKYCIEMSDEKLLAHLSCGLKETDFAWEEYRHRIQQLGDHVMTVGFHKGRKISEVPRESLEKELILSKTDNWLEGTCPWKIQKYAFLLLNIKNNKV